MLFNVENCRPKCLHAGHGNTGVNYEMGGTILCKTVKEKDLTVICVFSQIVRLGNTVLKMATPGSQDGPPEFCIGINGPKTDTHSSGVS